AGAGAATGCTGTPRQPLVSPIGWSELTSENAAAGPSQRSAVIDPVGPVGPVDPVDPVGPAWPAAPARLPRSAIPDSLCSPRTLAATSEPALPRTSLSSTDTPDMSAITALAWITAVPGVPARSITLWRTTRPLIEIAPITGCGVACSRVLSA